VTPNQSADIQNFITTCFASSFNAIHDPNEYGIEAVEIESDVVLPIPTTQIASWSWSIWLYGYYAFMMTYHCDLCPPVALHSSRYYPEWEEGFCACLQESEFDDLKTASECRIEVQNDGTQLEIQEEASQPKAAASSEVLGDVISNQETRYSFKVDIPNDVTPNQSADIQNFITTCFASSFNAIHDPNEYGIEAVEIESDVVLPIPTTQIASWSWSIWLYGYYAFMMTYHCDLCPPVALHSSRYYPEWEEGFCACLQESEFDDLKTASECRIEVQNEETQLEIQEDSSESEVDISFASKAIHLVDH